MSRLTGELDSVAQTPDSLAHISIVPLGAWGHTKAGSALASKLARTRSTRISLLVADYLYEKVLKELNERFIRGSEDDLKDMIRVIGVSADQLSPDTTLIKQSVASVFRMFMAGQPVPIRPDHDTTFPDIGLPGLLLLDNYFLGILWEVRSITHSKMPIYSLTSLVAIAALFNFGPEELGGGGDLEEKVKVINDLEGEEWDKEADKIYRRVRNEVLNLPGLPPMHDYEHYPQKMIFPGAIAKISLFCHKFFVQCDGIVLNTSSSLEGPAIDAWKSWFKDRPVICPGPFDFPLIDQEPVRTEENSEALTFLDAALEKYGPKSVVYMSFGSLWWSTEPEKIWAALDVLIERQTPFMFAHASPYSSVPDEIITKIKNCGFGYESTWIPQTEVLHHKACGWFVSHCGQNSVMESICAGVPIIAWPFEADQPSNAAYISSTHSIGYELFEIRSGYGLLPIARLNNRVPTATVSSVRSEFEEVLGKAFGEDGERKRGRVLKLRERCVEEWKEGGVSWREVGRIVGVARETQMKYLL